MSTTKKYANPPLVEAICEFHFMPQEGINNFSFVDTYYETIKEDFPVKGIRERIGVQFSSDATGKVSVPSILKDIDLHQFRSKDNTTLVQLGENLITVNHLKVYTTWEIFKPVIKKNVEKFLEIRKAEVFASAIIRYINKVDLDKQDNFLLSDYFNFDVKIPEGLPQEVYALNIRTDLWYENGADLCTIVLTSAPVSMPDKYSFFFDITYTSQREIEKSNITNWLENAHINLNTVFEKCLTDRCKEKFN